MRHITKKQITDVLKKHSKSKDISNALAICDREWRAVVNNFNQDFENQERLIISNNQGYRMTTNKKEIKAYAFRLIHHSLSELRNAKRILDALSSKNQITFFDEEENIHDLISKLDEAAKGNKYE